MKTEMDLIGMDERQREGWLKANRGTLIAVGVLWIGMIVREFAAGNVPTFLIVMVPAIACLRLLLYRWYTRSGR